MGRRIEEHSFSIEMNSKESVRSMSFDHRKNDCILFEGFLGRLKNVTLVEGVMLEIVGINGILKLDITQEEIKNFFAFKEDKHEWR